MMKRLLFLLGFLSLLFAQTVPWHTTAMLGIMISVLVLFTFYLLTYIVDSREMRAFVTDDLYQVFFTLFLLALFFSIDSSLSSIIDPIIGDFFIISDSSSLPQSSESMRSVYDAIQDPKDHIDYAFLSTLYLVGKNEEVLKVLTDISKDLGKQASTGGSCSFLGIGASYAGCSGIAVPLSSVSASAPAVLSGVLALLAQTFLLVLSKDFFFPFLLPIGLFLRSFSFTRGAGGFLIAFAFSFYFIYPFGILITKGMVDTAAESLKIDDTAFSPEDFTANEGSCDPFALDVKYTKNAVKVVLSDDLLKPSLYWSFIGGTFSSVLSLLYPLSATAALSKVFGAEIDVSALARIA
ncbi:hypothetical protein KAW38_03415 [Candidatus Micrarchaeota archaeon]|nr:hypothetical protein [Candidatus Micrarchaeota archaeon]